jgi:hypothetical protein
VEAAQRCVSGVTIFDPVLHSKSPSGEQHVTAPPNIRAEIKTLATVNTPDWEREGRLWAALEVFFEDT